MCARRRGQQGSQPTTCCVIRPVSSDRGPGFEAPLASLAAVSADIAGARAGFFGYPLALAAAALVGLLPPPGSTGP